MTDALPPHDTDAEKNLLGSVLIAPEIFADVIDLIQPHDFYSLAHEQIFTAMLAVAEQGEKPDAFTVDHYLRSHGEAARVGGAAYLHTLTEGVGSPASAAFYAKIVKKAAEKRRLVEFSTRLHQQAQQSPDDPDDLISGAYEALDRISTQQATGSATVSVADSVMATLAQVEQGVQSGVPTGFADFDHLTTGLHGGQLILIAARPGVGKSTLAMDIARHAAITKHLPTAFFSLEMQHTDLTIRLLSAHARVPLQHLRTGELSDDEWQRLADRLPTINAAPLYIDDTPAQSPGEIKAKCRRIQSRHGLGLVVIDYLQLMQSRGRVESRQQEVSDFSRGLKLMAKELNVPVIALSQLNRGPEQRTDKRPMLSDLRESGSLEQDADLVVLLHREDLYDPDTPRIGEADMIIAKHRQGPTGTITLAWQSMYSRFSSIAAEP